MKIKRQYGLIILILSLCDLLGTMVFSDSSMSYIIPLIGVIVGSLIFFRQVSKSAMSQYKTRHVFWSDEDECYIATLPEFPFLSGLGDTKEEALRELEIALEASIRLYEDEGWPLPVKKEGEV